MTTLSTYLQIANNLPKWQAMTAKSAEVATQTQYFKDHIGKATSIDAFMKDTRLFNYAMTAFGLGDMTYAKGLMQKVLEGGVSSGSALANTITNANIKAFAQAFDFAANGETTTSSPTLVDNVVSRYTEQALETNQGQQNPGVRLALYFQQHAPNLTSVYGILADRNILTVVQTALGVSPLTASQSIDTQYRLLSSKVNLDDFKDPSKLRQFIARFAAQYDYNNGGDANSQSSLLSTLFDGSSSGAAFGLDTSLLLSVQGTKFGYL